MPNKLGIDTVPLPEKPIEFVIPADLLKEFRGDVRIVVRYPWVIGVPVPFEILERIAANKGLGQQLTKNGNVMVVP